MMALERRVREVLGDRTESLWEDLIQLYEHDPEAFYLLACDGAGEPIQDLASLAGQVRSAIRESYEIEQAETGPILVSSSGKRLPIPDKCVSQVVQFLRTIDGAQGSAVPGKDYVGTAVSEAEIRFKLGERSSWHDEHISLQSRLETPPLVLRLHAEEIEHLASQPAYVTHGLLHCARKTILAPTSVFKGLNRGDDCPNVLKEGWAFCGKPRVAYDNQGRAFPAPSGMVYMVYANSKGFVFDWDWVQESPGEAGYPIDPDMRFENPCTLQRDAVLELPRDLNPGKLLASQACYSSQGDCIFCYMADEVSYAVRINSDLTVFKSLNGDQYTGFKIKNVRRILQVDQTIEMTDAPGLTVAVDSVLLATLQRHPKESVQVYRVLIQALYKSASEPPEVRVPAATNLVGA